jgi:hypothetical protein
LGRGEVRHSAWFEDLDDDLATTPLIVAEVDHPIRARGGRTALSGLRADRAAGAYLVEWWPSAIAAAVSIAERYADNDSGLPTHRLSLSPRNSTPPPSPRSTSGTSVSCDPLAAATAFQLLPADSTHGIASR